MTVQHAALDGNDIHEPKGVHTAALRSFYVADGNGSGTWQFLPFTFIQTEETPFVITAPTVWTPVSFTSHTLFTETGVSSSNLRITLTAARTQVCRVSFGVVIAQDDGTHDVYVTLAKNGVAIESFQRLMTLDINEQYPVLGYVMLTLSTNDYIEMMVKCVAGDITIDHPTLSLCGMPS